MNKWFLQPPPPLQNSSNSQMGFGKSHSQLIDCNSVFNCNSVYNMLCFIYATNLNCSTLAITDAIKEKVNHREAQIKNLQQMNRENGNRQQFINLKKTARAIKTRCIDKSIDNLK